MEIVYADLQLPTNGVVAVGVLDERALTPSAAALDENCRGVVVRSMAPTRFKGQRGEFLDVLVPSGTNYERIVLVGMGKAKDLTATRLQDIGGGLVAHLNGAGVSEAVIALDAVEGAPVVAAEAAARVGFGARLRAYRFDKYRTKEKEENKPTLSTLTIMTSAHSPASQHDASFAAVAEGVFLTRDLVSEPANVMYPEALCDRAKALTQIGVDVEILDEAEMEQLGMGSLLGVGQGSAHESKLLIMRWNGADDDEPPLAFVGKGVTFDTGGISIKPAAGMEDMKWDMGGAGVVVGLMKALAGRNAKVNVVGVAGLVENMPSSTAQRPGDVVKSMSGQTIEVINTDAEGRLVLADALWYTQDRFKPKFMIDLATLTGAIIISLGNQHAGLFSNNEELAERLAACGKAVGELVWQLPLGDAYDKQLMSDIADMKNVGGREAGSITAAQFLQRFVNDVPWAHLDIAGVTWSKKDAPTVPKGGTAFGVQLLNQLVAQFYEKK